MVDHVPKIKFKFNPQVADRIIFPVEQLEKWLNFGLIYSRDYTNGVTFEGVLYFIGCDPNDGAFDFPTLFSRYFYRSLFSNIRDKYLPPGIIYMDKLFLLSQSLVQADVNHESDF